MAEIARKIRLSIPSEGKFTEILFSEKISDSRILHYTLCEIDPGENFTVEFSNTTISPWGNAPYVHGENDRVHEYTWRRVNCPVHN